MSDLIENQRAFEIGGVRFLVTTRHRFELPTERINDADVILQVFEGRVVLVKDRTNSLAATGEVPEQAKRLTYDEVINAAFSLAMTEVDVIGLVEVARELKENER